MAVHSLPGSRQFDLFNWRRILALLLLVIICSLLILIVQLEHQVRHLETRYAKALQSEVDLHQEFGKLTLELHHLTALARVEDIASSQLNMTLDKSSKKHNLQTIYLQSEPATLQAPEPKSKGVKDAN